MSDTPYQRQPIAAVDPVGGDGGSETLAMIWRDGATCAPHDHGAAAGTIHVISGAVVERRYAFRDGALIVVAETAARAPAVLTIEVGVIHDMRAAPGVGGATGGTVTVHHYSPRIHAMRVYDLARRETLIVADDCGAWIPEDPTQVIERLPWHPR